MIDYKHTLNNCCSLKEKERRNTEKCDYAFDFLPQRHTFGWNRCHRINLFNNSLKTKKCVCLQKCRVNFNSIFLEMLFWSHNPICQCSLRVFHFTLFNRSFALSQPFSFSEKETFDPHDSRFTCYHLWTNFSLEKKTQTKIEETGEHYVIINYVNFVTHSRSHA